MKTKTSVLIFGVAGMALMFAGLFLSFIFPALSNSVISIFVYSGLLTILISLVLLLVIFINAERHKKLDNGPVDKIEPFIEPLLIPLFLKALYWIFVLSLVVTKFNLSYFIGENGVYLFLEILYFSTHVASVAVLVYLILLWLKVIKPRALIKGNHPIWLQWRWSLVLIALFVIVYALGESFDMIWWKIVSIIHPPIETAG